jgi:hypothetical protein
VPKDLVEAYAWFALAEKNGLSSAARNRDAIAGLLTPEEKTKAEQLLLQRSAPVSAGN